jgi:hypothetical protein
VNHNTPVNQLPFIQRPQAIATTSPKTAKILLLNSQPQTTTGSQQAARKIFNSMEAAIGPWLKRTMRLYKASIIILRI